MRLASPKIVMISYVRLDANDDFTIILVRYNCALFQLNVIKIKLSVSPYNVDLNEIVKFETRFYLLLLADILGDMHCSKQCNVCSQIMMQYGGWTVYICPQKSKGHQTYRVSFWNSPFISQLKLKYFIMEYIHKQLYTMKRKKPAKTGVLFSLCVI